MLTMLIAAPVLILLIIGSLLAVISGFAFGVYLMVHGGIIVYSSLTEPCQGLCLSIDSPSVGGLMILGGLIFTLLAYKAIRG